MFRGSAASAQSIDFAVRFGGSSNRLKPLKIGDLQKKERRKRKEKKEEKKRKLGCSPSLSCFSPSAYAQHPTEPDCLYIQTHFLCAFVRE